MVFWVWLEINKAWLRYCRKVYWTKIPVLPFLVFLAFLGLALARNSYFWAFSLLFQGFWGFCRFIKSLFAGGFLASFQNTRKGRTRMVQNGRDNHSGQNDLVPNKISAFTRLMWTQMVHLAPFWWVRFGTQKTGWGEITELCPWNLVRAQKTHWARCLKPCSLKPCLARLQNSPRPPFEPDSHLGDECPINTSNCLVSPGGQIVCGGVCVCVCVFRFWTGGNGNTWANSENLRKCWDNPGTIPG